VKTGLLPEGKAEITVGILCVKNEFKKNTFIMDRIHFDS
jgi:hypothetical protein